MKLFLLVTIAIFSLILAPLTEGGICSRISARRASRAEARVERNLLLGDRIILRRVFVRGTLKASGC